jgi:dimethylaniline monooxygenase (N-oxide forming)
VNLALNEYESERGMSDKVCVIGAGVSGLATIKAFKDAGIAFDCFDVASDIGGLWKYQSDNGVAASYRGLHINTSKQMMQFADYPMPESLPQYPHHRDVWKYFSDYADQFDLRPAISFRHRIDHVEPINRGANGYDVTVTNLDSNETTTQRYARVVVANGHHWSPKMIEFPGQFDGEITHARNYDAPDQYALKRVLVVGIGNSAVDIAAETSYVSEQTFLSTRRSAWVLPRFAFGKPIDQFDTPIGARLPLWIKRAMYRTVVAVAVGNQENYGIRKPKHKLLCEHPTMSSALLERAAHGEVIVKPNIKQLLGDRVLFEDGSEEQIDCIVMATGYYIKFPFFDEDMVSAPENQISLYRRMIHPDYANLYFVGLFQVLGAMMPIAELQGKWIAKLVDGTVSLPDSDSMRQIIEKDKTAMARRYVNSTRHTIQVDYWPYIFELRKAVAGKLDRSRQVKS